LPGLFSSNLKKNFIYDLINNRSDQFLNVHKESKFQFYNIEGIWQLIDKCKTNNITLLNVATEPVSAQEIASIFEIELGGSQGKVEYCMKTKFSSIFNGREGFLQDKAEVLEGISKLRNSN
jgi:hypothetical protein